MSNAGQVQDSDHIRAGGAVPADGSADELAVLNALKLKGFAQPATVASATGLDPATVAGVLQAAAAAGHAARREGRISGWLLTKPGRERLGALLQAERALLGSADRLQAAYDAFLPLNSRFKEFCTSWQTRSESPADTAAGEAVDEHFRSRLRDVDVTLEPVLSEVAAVLPRFAAYRPRFAAAAARFDRGEAGALARPLSDSYHDVWMELHQDLLATLGRQRTAEDGD